jgi:hypothetical protein
MQGLRLPPHEIHDTALLLCVPFIGVLLTLNWDKRHVYLLINEIKYSINSIAKSILFKVAAAVTEGVFYYHSNGNCPTRVQQ